MRLLWLTFGLICVAAAMIGVILPLIPTVPFLLLATFCFARSSERLHHWLVTHRRFGPAIEDWNDRGAIRPTAKRLATVSIIAVFTLSLVMQLRPMILVIQAITLSAVLVFIWTRPN